MKIRQFRQFGIGTILLALAILPWQDSHAGAKEGGVSDGGGHGVVQPDGKLSVLDLFREADETPDAHPEIKIGEAELTREAAHLAIDRLRALFKQYPDFVQSMEEILFERMRWAVSDQPLRLVEDANLQSPLDHQLVQLAYQYERGKVLLDERKFTQLEDLPNKAALIVHEVLLAKLGLDTPRPTLRTIVRAALADDVSLAENAIAAINRISPHILRGEQEIRLEITDRFGVMGERSIWVDHQRCSRNSNCRVVRKDLKEVSITLRETTIGRGWTDYRVMINGKAVKASRMAIEGGLGYEQLNFELW